MGKYIVKCGICNNKIKTANNEREVFLGGVCKGCKRKVNNRKSELSKMVSKGFFRGPQ